MLLTFLPIFVFSIIFRPFHSTREAISTLTFELIYNLILLLYSLLFVFDEKFSEKTKYALLGNPIVILLTIALVITIIISLYELVRSIIKIVRGIKNMLKKEKK